MDKKEFERIKAKVLELFAKANVILTDLEKESIEIADFGLNKIKDTGLQLITYVNTEKVCAKELALLPYQTCPEHKHPPRGFDDGKEETFRCRYGTVYLYVEGEATKNRTMNPQREMKNTIRPLKKSFCIRGNNAQYIQILFIGLRRVVKELLYLSSQLEVQMKVISLRIHVLKGYLKLPVSLFCFDYLY